MAEQIRGTAEERRKPVSRRRAWIPVQARTGPAFWRPVPRAGGDRRNLCGQTGVWISGERPTRNSPGSIQRLWTLLVPFASVSQLKEKFSQEKVPDRPEVRGGSGYENDPAVKLQADCSGTKFTGFARFPWSGLGVLDR